MQIIPHECKTSQQIHGGLEESRDCPAHGLQWRIEQSTGSAHQVPAESRHMLDVKCRGWLQRNPLHLLPEHGLHALVYAPCQTVQSSQGDGNPQARLDLHIIWHYIQIRKCTVNAFKYCNNWRSISLLHSSLHIWWFGCFFFKRQTTAKTQLAKWTL